MAARSKRRFLFAHTYWDAIPILAACLHVAFVLSLFYAWRHHAPWWVLGTLGITYSFSISWNINGISHNFIHNPYFKSKLLNQLFSLLESVVCGFSQTFYDVVHRQHHMGNSDLPDDGGKTIDPLSIYAHGHHGEAENPWGYIFLSYFRDDIGGTYRELKRRGKFQAMWGLFEIACTVSSFIIGIGYMLLTSPAWTGGIAFGAYWLFFYYLGNCASSLNGYYLHYGGNPDVPIAWGVSSYGFLYNLIWFNNGYHAEHHYRPKWHWTKMRSLRDQIKSEQVKAGVRVIVPPHALGFLDPDLPPLSETGAHRPQASSAVQH
jgi:fatty acid desaturase